MTEREKIINIIQSVKFCEADSGCGGCKYETELDNYSYVACRTLRIADALIENGIGDIIEWKRKAEVAERNDKLKEKALNNACAMLYAQGVESPFSDEDWHLRQAEKEFAEKKE